MKKAVILFAGILGLSSAIWPMDDSYLFIDVFGGGGLADYEAIPYFPYGGNIGWAISDDFFIESGYRRIGGNNDRRNIFEFGFGFQFSNKYKLGIANDRLLFTLNFKALYTDKDQWGFSVKVFQYDRLFYHNNIGFKIGGGVEVEYLPDLIDIDKGEYGAVLFFNVGFLFYPNRIKKIAAYERQQEEERQLHEQRVWEEIQSREQKRQEEQRLQEQRKQEEEAEQKSMAELYSNILKSSGVVQFASYIKNYSGNRYFQKDSYTEIARRLTGNVKIDLLTLPSGYDADIPNPYNFNDNVIYFCQTFTVQQWIDTSFLADISNGRSRANDSLIYIRNVYDVRNIGRTVTNAYLRYAGTTTYQAVSGAHTVVPMFDLLYSF